jgi:hypothetical protein
MRYHSADWSVDIPDSWRHTEHPECVTFEPTTGESAFQISAYRKDADITDYDLREFAGDVSLTRISLPRFSGYEATSTEKQMFSRRWWVRAGRSMLFVTYTCPPGARGRDDSAVEAMLHSLSPSHAATQV